MSSVLDYDKTSNEVVISNPENHFVFGGDVCDKGGSDLYVLRHLLSLKQRYPKNVHFILGNRDINKMRITQEIEYKRNGFSNIIPVHNGCYWLKGSGHIGDPEMSNVPVNNVDRLKWMLKGTMGCPETFELRRTELKEDIGKNVTDDEVLKSFVETCDPFGLFGQYLSSANLALRIGTTLFVHGALPITDQVIDDDKDDPSSLWNGFNFAMPWSNRSRPQDEGKAKLNFDDWILQLNDFAEKEIQSWKKQEKFLPIWASTGGYAKIGSSGGGSLMQYGMGWTANRIKNPTVVYNSWEESNTFKDIYTQRYIDLLYSFFDDYAKLQLIVTGHQPQGDLPSPIQVFSSENSNTSINPCWILRCDTSFSGDTLWLRNNEVICYGRGNSISGRGESAVSEVIIEQCSENGDIINVTTHGNLSDSSSYKAMNLLDCAKYVGKPLQKDKMKIIGGDNICSDLLPNSLRNKWWVKAKLTDGNYIVSVREGFKVWNAIATLM